jgi:hypothetical protein
MTARNESCASTSTSRKQDQSATALWRGKEAAVRCPLCTLPIRAKCGGSHFLNEVDGSGRLSLSRDNSSRSRVTIG